VRIALIASIASGSSTKRIRMGQGLDIAYGIQSIHDLRRTAKDLNHHLLRLRVSDLQFRVLLPDLSKQRRNRSIIRHRNPGIRTDLL